MNRDRSEPIWNPSNKKEIHQPKKTYCKAEGVAEFHQEDHHISIRQSEYNLLDFIYFSSTFQKANKIAINLVLEYIFTTFWFRFVKTISLSFEREFLSVEERHKKPLTIFMYRSFIIIVIVILFHRRWVLSYRRQKKY